MLIYLQVIETEEDKNKFEDIYQKYRGLMYYVAYKRLHHEQDAEDAVHHAFMKIAENITAIDPVSPKTKQFVVTIVDNRVTDMLRMNGRHPAAEYNDEILSGLSSELHTDDLLTEAILKLPEQGKTTVPYKKISANGTTREQQICMTEYIRHQIHHPENTYNARFNDSQLRRSIEDMRAFVTSKAQTPETT